jgi:formate dehydrogenase assembly factor FdhD
MGKRSVQTDILRISRDAEWKKMDELAHEEEVTVRLNGEIQKFYCIPVDLEEMIAGNLNQEAQTLLHARSRNWAALSLK